MLDQEGYRPNVGIVLVQPNLFKMQTADVGAVENATIGKGEVSTDKGFWARRIGGHDAWQFPQGGINDGETPEAAVMRELHEEIGVEESAVKILGQTNGWLKYDLPLHMRRNNSTPGFVGQKQKWFLMRFLGEDADININTEEPEFSAWKWIAPSALPAAIVPFKRDVYVAVLAAFQNHL